MSRGTLAFLAWCLILGLTGSVLSLQPLPVGRTDSGPGDGKTTLGALTSKGGGQRDITNGLVAYWSFDEWSGDTAHDYSGNGNHGLIEGGATWTTGISGSALEFDGIDDNVNLNNHIGNLAFDITDDYTFSGWINTISTGGSRCVFMWCESGGAGPGFYGTVTDSIATVYAQNLSPNAIKASSNVACNDGAWHHIVAVYYGHTSNPTIEMYFDGQLVDDSTGYLPSFSASDFERARIGRYGHVGEGFFHGLIDEVRVYDRALHIVEIRYLYDRTYICGDLNGDGNGPNIVDLTYLVSYLFDGGEAPVCGP